MSRCLPALLLLLPSASFALDVAVLAATDPAEVPLGTWLGSVYAAQTDLSFIHIEVGSGWTPADLETLDAYDVIVLAASRAQMADPNDVEEAVNSYRSLFGPVVTGARLAHDRSWRMDDALSLAAPDGAPGLGFSGTPPESFDRLRTGHPILAGVHDFFPPDVLIAEAIPNATVLATFDGTDVPAVAITAGWFDPLSGYAATLNTPGLYGDDYRPDGWPADGDGYTLLANTLRFVADNAAPHLLVEGDCPGTMLVRAIGISPGGRFALASGETFVPYGSPIDPAARIPGGPCAGEGLPLAEGTVTLRNTFRANASGHRLISVQVSEPAVCETFLAVVDLERCVVSNTFSWGSGI
jgi:hypothetical protein